MNYKSFVKQPQPVLLGRIDVLGNFYKYLNVSNGNDDTFRIFSGVCSIRPVGESLIHNTIFHRDHGVIKF
jgi:hypothetical protein